MFISSLASLSFASILSILPPVDTMGDVESGAAITRYSSPAMAGLWELDTSPITSQTPQNATINFNNNINSNSSVNTSVLFDDENKVDENKVTGLTDSNVAALSAEEATARELANLSDAMLTINERKTINRKTINIVNPTSETIGDIVVANNTDTLETNQCVERYNFSSDDNMWTVSGAEWTQGEYVVQPLSQDPNSLPLLVIKTLYDNNEPDCTNSQVDQTGDVLAVYLDYRPDEQKMYWCKDSEGAECIMQFNRILP